MKSAGFHQVGKRRENGSWMIVCVNESGNSPSNWPSRNRSGWPGWEPLSSESILQLRADSLSDSAPLRKFWDRWRKTITGTNRYRTSA
jgi:hypothetical protein